MNLQDNENTAPLIIGASCGPVFGVLDLTKYRNRFCYKKLVKTIPNGLIALSQIIILMTPEQAKSHRCIGDSGCSFDNVDFENCPDVNYIARAWFPGEFGSNGDWKETSISFGGTMVATEHLINKTDLDGPYTFAFWCSLTKTWEVLSTKAIEDKTHFVELTLQRTDFRPPENVYDIAQREIETLDLGLWEESLKMTSALTDSLPEPMKASGYKICTAAFIDRFDKFKSNTSLNIHPQLIPFLPLFVGEIHCVVPSEFFISTALKGSSNILKSMAEKVTLLKRLPDILDTTDDVLGYFPADQDALSLQDTDYPLKEAECGWTFFRGSSPSSEGLSASLNNEMIMASFADRFLTIEPGPPILPPFGNSASGAVACAVTKSLLYDITPSTPKFYQGNSGGDTAPWGTRFIKGASHPEEKSIQIQKTEEGQFILKAPVRIFGSYTDFNN